MCKKYIYARVSTSKQSFEQQMQDIKNYGINPEDVDGIVTEHESGGKSYCDREFQKLLNSCESGDIIYAASTDRLGRSFVDMIRLMEDAKKRGIIIVACKQGLSLADDNMATKIILAVTAIVDEDERMRIKHRIKNKRDWQREQIEKYGYFIVERGINAGKPCTTMGSHKGHDTSAACMAAAQLKIDQAIQWREDSIAYKWVLTQIASGKTRGQVIDEFNKLHELQPDVFCTRTGKKLSKGLLSHWLKGQA